MKGLIWKRLLVAGCIVALLLNATGISVIADEVGMEGIDSSKIEDSISIVSEDESNPDSQIEIFQEEIKQELSEPEKMPDSKVSDDNSVNNNHEKQYTSEPPIEYQVPTESDEEDSSAEDIFSMIVEDVPDTFEEVVGAGDDYPANLKNAARDSIIDPWNFYNRECTSFVAWCLNSRNGVGFTNQYLGASRWGHAKTWGTVASSLGVRVDKNPAVGSVAWWNTGDYGHVAWVSSVNGGNVFIEEYNYNYTGAYHTRTIAASDPAGYIHIKDIDPVITVNFTPWSNDNYTYIRKTDASIGMEINVSGGTCTSTGMYLYDSNGSYLAQGRNSEYTYPKIYFKINEECGYTLSSWTTYKYKFYAIVNGQTYWSNEYSFETLPDVGEEMSQGFDAILPNGDYAIVSAADAAYYLDIVGTEVPATGGTNVALCGPNGGHLPAYEIWNLQYSDGFYAIRQKDTDVCLDVTNASRNSNANIQMCQSNGSSAQKWAISRFGDKKGYRLQAKCSGFSLDIKGASISSGSNVQQHLNNDSDAQRWLLIPYEPERTIADGRYILVSALDPRLVLDVSGDTADVPNGTNVQVWNDSASSRYNSIDVQYLDHGYYRLTHAASGKSLDVQGSYPIAGTNIQLFTAGDQNNQKWAITKQGSGYIIWSRCSGLVVDVYNGNSSDGTNVTQTYYNGSNAQIWKFVQAEYNVKYNANGGTGAPASQTKYYRNPLILSSAKPSLSGSTFKGWSTSKTATSAEYQAGGSYIQDKDITLYAVWETQETQISSCKITLSPTSYTYNGKARKPAVTIKDGEVILTSGTDYTVAYSNNTNVGTATVTVTGKGNYSGTVNKTFKIKQAAPKLKFASATISKTTLDSSFTNKLTKTTDGNVTFKSSNTAVATVNSTSGKVTIKGIGTATITASATAGTNYKAGSASYTLTIIDGRTDISKCTVTLSATSYTYNGKAKKPAVTVMNGTVALTSDTDYTVAYSNNKNAGTATVVVTGMGNYTGTNSTTFMIKKAAPKLTFTSENVTKVISDDAFINELTKTTDGIVTLNSSDTNVATVNSTSGIVTIRGAGTATIIATATAGKNYKAGTARYTLTVDDGKIDISTGTARTKYKVYNYTGKVRQPAMILVVDSVTLVKDTDYILSYKNDIAVGTATVTAKGIGKYKGTISCDYMIKDIIPVYRLFNRKTGEHFYTASTTERQQYLNAGNWNAEGIAWYAPKKSSEPIYRLSNPNNGNEHHYTKSKSEKDWLVGLGWHYDCVAWYSDTDKVIPIYRHYHPIQRTGNHHYTTSKGESDHIVKYEGWNYEGIAFYVSRAGG